MDLLSTLSAASGGLTARLGTTSGGVCGDGACGAGTTSGGDGFMATLAGLLDPASAPVDENTLGQWAELASAAPDQEDAVVWSLGLLQSVAGSRLATERSDGGVDAEGELEGGEAGTVGEMSHGDAASGVTVAVGDPVVEAAAPELLDELDQEAGGSVDQGEPADAMPTVARATSGPSEAATTAAPAMTDEQATDGPRDARPNVPAATIDRSPRADEAPLRRSTLSGAATVDTDEVTSQNTHRSVRADTPTGSSIADAVRAADHAPPPAPGATSSIDPTSRPASMADGVRRVLEAIELLENAPPPRHLTIDVGEARVRVALEDNAVRVTVLDGASDDLDELLRAAEDALAEQGFDLGGERGGRQDHHQPDDRLTAPPSRSTRADARGLRL